MDNSSPAVDASNPSRIHLLDVGRDQYGDCVLCEVGGRSILIDGGHRADLRGSTGHPSIPAQLADILGVDEGAACHVSLLIVSHAHDDHIGCLPEMVSQDLLTTDWALMVDPDFAWGHTTDADPNQPIDRLTALLREEPRGDLGDRLAFNAAVKDAVGLQKRYRDMIARLKKNGTTVVLHGRSPLGPLQDHFKDISLEILGPPKKQMEACRDAILGFGRDMRRDFATKVHSDSDIFAIYRELQRSATLQDAPDAFKGTGPAINLQSSIVVFGDGKHRFLFTGDAQLEKPEVSSDEVRDGVADVLAAIAERQPYDFVKLGHHGSYNAFGDRFLEQIGEDSVNFGICTGSESHHHPSAAALKILKENKDRLTWVRTDRNGRSTFTFGDDDPSVEVTHRDVNDLTMPGDLAEQQPFPSYPAPAPALVEGSGALPPAAPSPQLVQVEPGALPGPIEIKIPYAPQLGVSLSLKLDIAPSPSASPDRVGQIIAQPRTAPESIGHFQLASGRSLPKLLFATSEAGLGSNIGAETTAMILAAVKKAGHVLVSDVPQGTLESQTAASAVRAALRVNGDVAGVVLLGGFDVVPSQRRDALPPALRRKVRGNDDDDNYIVWSDAVYGDVDGDGLAELPVSRIPDGRSATLVLRALGAPKATLSRRNGVRNVMRPFADTIYANLRGASDILRSHPTSVTNSQHTIDGDHVYLMLHGDYIDATRFWGETEDFETLEAVNLSTVAVPPGAVVFTGCCWGALTVREPACSIRPGMAVTPRTPDQSLALRFLERGALALIGCTGTHYSPTEEPYNYFGGPMHREFWAALFKHHGAPAPALFEAKQRYLAGIPHISSGATVEAIERKIYEQYTCLGLGW